MLCTNCSQRTSLRNHSFVQLLSPTIVKTTFCVAVEISVMYQMFLIINQIFATAIAHFNVNFV